MIVARIMAGVGCKHNGIKCGYRRGQDEIFVKYHRNESYVNIGI